MDIYYRRGDAVEAALSYNLAKIIANVKPLWKRSLPELEAIIAKLRP